MMNLFGRKAQATLKEFYSAVGKSDEQNMAKLGVQSIRIKTIVGSVGRADELDANFCSKRRGWSERHQRLQAFMQQGKALPPIKVFMIRCGDVCEHYIFDGHHRVAAAIKLGYSEINAEVTEVTPATVVLH